MEEFNITRAPSSIKIFFFVKKNKFIFLYKWIFFLFKKSASFHFLVIPSLDPQSGKMP